MDGEGRRLLEQDHGLLTVLCGNDLRAVHGKHFRGDFPIEGIVLCQQYPVSGEVRQRFTGGLLSGGMAGDHRLQG